jgi:hypothetical protein
MRISGLQTGPRIGGGAGAGQHPLLKGADVVVIPDLA